MKDDKLKRTIIIWVTIIIIIAAASTILSSCNPEKKIQKAISTLKSADRLDDVCATEYPVKVVTDSTEYKNSKAIIDELIKKAELLKKDSLISQEERERLLIEIEKIKNSITVNNCDSLSDAIYRLAAKEKKRGDKLEQINKDLVLALNNIKPVHDTLENTAKYNSLLGKLDSLSRSNYLLIKDKDKTTGERDKFKGRSKTYLWILILALLVLFSKTFFNIYTAIKSKLP